MNIEVSITIMSFNHENYIKECIESALSQKTNFDFEILIGDDASTDTTKNIISTFNDSRIKFIDRKENIGLHKNIEDLFSKCKGKYIALLEGDDFWINTNKIQLQYDLLEKNLDCSVCFTDAITFTKSIDKGRALYKNNKSNPNTKFDLHYFLNNTITIPNNTKMFRKSFHPKFLPKIFFKGIQWDWVLHILHGLNGNFIFSSEITLAYRRHDNAMINEKNMENILNDAIYLVYNIKQILPEAFWKYFTHPKFELNSLAFVHLKNRKFSKFIVLYIKWVKVISINEFNFRDEFYKFRKNIIKNDIFKH